MDPQRPVQQVLGLPFSVMWATHHLILYTKIHCLPVQFRRWLVLAVLPYAPSSVLSVFYVSHSQFICIKLNYLIRTPVLPGIAEKVNWDYMIFMTSYSKQGLPGGSEIKASTWNAGDLGSVPGSGKIPWRRKWQLTRVLLPGDSHGQTSLVGNWEQQT